LPIVKELDAALEKGGDDLLAGFRTAAEIAACGLKAWQASAWLLVGTDAFAGYLTRGSFKTIRASEETTNTQRFEADSLADDAGCGEQ
jgi:hypothetical protein